MERIVEGTKEIQLSFSKLTVEIRRLGSDFQVTVWGGDRPHVGCCVLAVPRASLTGDGSVSVTSSVLNVTGHKDEQICRYLAEKIAVEEQAVVVCSGGFHVDGITKEQIAEVLEAVKEL